MKTDPQTTSESRVSTGTAKTTGLTTYARHLRRHATDAERLLWKHLRARQCQGFKFRRQVVIEADGGQHAEQIDDDARRTALLEAMGYRVLRFWNHEILRETSSVLEKIEMVLMDIPSPPPSPGGRGS